jgi:hypothetical protein
MSSQVKAISMIVAIEGLIPDRHPAQSKSPPPAHPGLYKAAWLRAQQNGESVDPQPPPAQADPGRADETPGPAPAPTPDPGEPTFFPGPLNPPETTSSVPRVPTADYFAPDTRVRFGGRR